MKYHLFFLFFLLSFSFIAQKSNKKEIIKELELLKETYSNIDNFSVDVIYRLFNNKDVVAIEKLEANLTKKGGSQLLKSDKHITLINNEYSLTIDHEQKVIVLQEANNKGIDPLSLKVTELLEMAINYEKLENLGNNQLGYRFSFYDNQYKSIDIIYNASTHFLVKTVLTLSGESGKIQIDYKNLKQNLTLSSTFFNTDKYFIKKDNTIELTNTYASYELFNYFF